VGDVNFFFSIIYINQWKKNIKNKNINKTKWYYQNSWVEPSG